MYIYMYIYMHILIYRSFGGVAGVSRTPNREIISFHSFVRCEAVCECETERF